MFNVVIWGTVGQWIAAICTLTAVLVALFKDDYVRWRRRPILRVTADLRSPHCAKALLGPIVVQRAAMTTLTAECYYLRLWIENVGKTRAEQVQVFLGRVFRATADAAFIEDTSYLPMNLRWSNSPPGMLPETYADGVSPEMGKHCDLLRIVDPKMRRDVGDDLRDVPATSVVGALQLEVVPIMRTDLLGPGLYRLELRVAAANCGPVIATLELNIVGTWHEDESAMFRNGIELRVI